MSRRTDTNDPSLTKGETLPLALLFQRPAGFDACLLLLELCSLSVELVLHLLVTSVELLFALSQLALLLVDLLLEDHLHLHLHLLELLLVQRALLLLLDRRVDLLEHAGVLLDTHCCELLRAVVLVENVVGVLLELFHMSADKHLSELDEIAMLLVVDFNDTPWHSATADLAAISCDNLVIRTDNGKGNLGHDLLVLGNGLLVIELVPGPFEDLDLVVGDIGEDLAWLAYANFSA